jgi:AcrR family transcriptional regulator
VGQTKLAEPVGKTRVAEPVQKTRLAERSEACIETLLRVARQTFGEHGYAATSLDGLAAAARLTKGAVYHHFGSKEALFEEVFRREHRATIAHVMATGRAAKDPVDAILKGIRTYLQTILDPVARRILLQDGPSILGWERWRRCEEPGFQQLMEASLTAAAKRGMLRAGLHPADTAVLLLGATTEGALTIAHAADPAGAARRLGRALAAHVDALCRR